MAVTPGWLHLGLWEGRRDATEALTAPQCWSRPLCEPLPAGGVILDVANGLGAQDLVFAERLRSRQLVALNLSEFQLNAGRERLASARALPVVGDAVGLVRRLLN